MNFAAETHVDRSISDPQDFIRTDVLGTHTLLEAARELGVGRYLQISTDEVYGSIEQGSFTEASPLCPSQPLLGQQGRRRLVVLSYVTTFGTPALITRSSNNYGPWQYPEKIVPLFVTNAIDDQPLPVYGDGLNVRDWLLVDDNCAGIDLVLRRGEPGEVYNIGGGHEVPNIELTREILRLLGKPETLVRWVADRPGHDRRYSVDCSKLRALGWAPQARLRPGPGAHREPGTRTTSSGGGPSSRASTATTTSASTRASSESRRAAAQRCARRQACSSRSTIVLVPPTANISGRSENSMRQRSEQNR